MNTSLRTVSPLMLAVLFVATGCVAPNRHCGTSFQRMGVPRTQASSSDHCSCQSCLSGTTSHPVTERIREAAGYASQGMTVTQNGVGSQEQAWVRDSGTLSNLETHADIMELVIPRRLEELSYMATIPCTEVTPAIEMAFLERLNDKYEAVRCAAAKAVAATAKTCQCDKSCNNRICCSPKIQARLQEMANAKTETGFVEDSILVRDAARQSIETYAMITSGVSRSIAQSNTQADQVPMQVIPSDAPNVEVEVFDEWKSTETNTITDQSIETETEVSSETTSSSASIGDQGSQALPTIEQGAGNVTDRSEVEGSVGESISDTSNNVSVNIKDKTQLPSAIVTKTPAKNASIKIESTPQEGAQVPNVENSIEGDVEIKEPEQDDFMVPATITVIDGETQAVAFTLENDYGIAIGSKILIKAGNEEAEFEVVETEGSSVIAQIIQGTGEVTVFEGMGVRFGLMAE